MAEENREYGEIKAGVDGILADIPSPTANEEIEAPTITEEIPESKTIGEEQEYQQPQLVDYGTQKYNTQNSGLNSETVQQIVEAIVKEKWDELESSVGNIAEWKERVNNNIVSMKQEIIRISEKFQNLQNAVLGKVGEYDQGLRGVHTEMKALEKVFEKILEPMTSNIKDLDRLVKEMKKAKK